MTISFADVLRSAGIEVDSVYLVRHQDRRSGKKTPFWLWCNDRTAFDRYQSLQSRPAFKVGSFLASFVAPSNTGTLFVGLYKVEGVGMAPEGTTDPLSGQSVEGLHLYDLRLVDALNEYAGKLAIDWGQGYRSWVQRANKGAKPIVELRRKAGEQPFPGYLRFKADLSEIQALPETWIDRLNEAKGVYVLTCPRTHEVYVGSATGEGGFFERWSQHAAKGGDAVQFRSRAPSDYQVSILEVAGSNASDRDIIHAEQLWMQKLQTREMGLNGGSLTGADRKDARNTDGDGQGRGTTELSMKSGWRSSAAAKGVETTAAVTSPPGSPTGDVGVLERGAMGDTPRLRDRPVPTGRSGETRNRMDWFERLTGFREDGYEKTKDKLSVDGDRLLCRGSDRSYAVGTLTLPSLSELRAAVAGVSLPGRPRLTIAEGDVRAMHLRPENRGALFQVASQFNMLEMVGPQVSPEAGVTGYEHDGTQGPACAMAAGAATLYRNYLVPVAGGIGQTSDRQLDGLADLTAKLARDLQVDAATLLTMRNGYALATRDGLAAIAAHLAKLSPEALDDLRELLRVGLHQDVEVTDSSGPGPRVSQIFCSALPVAYSGLSRSSWAPFACLVLEAAYEATLWAAVLNAARGASNRVLLTRLGGGAFGNDDAWIDRALLRALQIAGAFDLDIIIVSYGQPSHSLVRFVQQSGFGSAS